MAESPTVAGVGRALARQHAMFPPRVDYIRRCGGEERDSNLEDLARFLAAHLAAEYVWLADGPVERGPAAVADSGRYADITACFAVLEELPEDSLAFDAQLDLLSELLTRHASFAASRLLPGAQPGFDLERALDAIRSVPTVSTGNGSSGSRRHIPFRSRLSDAVLLFQDMPIDR